MSADEKVAAIVDRMRLIAVDGARNGARLMQIEAAKALTEGNHFDAALVVLNLNPDIVVNPNSVVERRQP